MKYNANDFFERYFNIEEMELFKVLDELPELGDGVWLGGGALRRTLVSHELDSDFDFFFSSGKKLKKFREELVASGANKTASNDHQETYTYQIGKKSYIIQLIKIAFYENPEDLIDSFDFTITQLAYDGEYLYCGDYTLWDLGRNRLALHKLTYGVATMRRMIKYTKQGYTACSGTMQSILEAVIENPDVVRSEIQYID
ncbi:hypothetical protein [Paenibacillus xylaniclasticus]|uniref:hypothetical protein n=1 Tax=Paenibacillus xylaniclasticus TaxID=588083 RepID=UPI000FDB5DE7|nr:MULTISPECIES: hypothetical protein [Paenibacillus]GFN32399.1 hypothetical protein PCURB6_26590 [Paenibacillus curdlanolyticus]